MDDQTSRSDPSADAQRPAADETFTFDGSNDSSSATNGAGTEGARGTAGAVIEQLRVAVDEIAERAGPTVRDLAERAAPTVREISARAAELTATAAVKAAPLVKRAGEVTADATEKLGEKSREWASGLRTATDDVTGSTGDTSGRPAPSDVSPANDESLTGDFASQDPIGTDTAPSFETTAESGTGGSTLDDERDSNSPGI
jgi:hypothetical protein